MVRAFELAHFMMETCVKPGERVVDATVGNGHDTLVLAELVGSRGHVLGFDVQEGALKSARVRLSGLEQVSLVHAGHERLDEFLPKESEGQLAGVMFNLGYLPGGDKSIVTCFETTLAGLEQALFHLRVGGLITLVLYRGHPGGEIEASGVHQFVARLPQEFSSSRYARINSLQPAPELLVIERGR